MENQPIRDTMQISIRVDKDVWKEIKRKAVDAGMQPGIYVEEVFKRHCANEYPKNETASFPSPTVQTSPQVEEVASLMGEVGDLTSQLERSKRALAQAERELCDKGNEIDGLKKEQDRLIRELVTVKSERDQAQRENGEHVARIALIDAEALIHKAYCILENAADKKARSKVEKHVKDAQKMLDKLNK